MARGREDDLDSAREAARDAARAMLAAAGPLTTFVDLLRDPASRAALGTVSEAMRAFSQANVAAMASAASALGSPASAEITEIAGRFIEPETMSAAARLATFAMTAEPFLTEYAVQQNSLAAVATRAMPSIAELAGHHETLTSMVAVMNPTLTEFAAARRLGLSQSEGEDLSRDQAKHLEALLSQFSDADIQIAANAAMWLPLGPIDSPRGRTSGARAPAFLPSHRDAFDVDHVDEVRESGLYLPTADDIILLDEEPTRRGPGRPLGSGRRPLTELLDGLACALIQLTSDQPERFRIAAARLAVEAAMHRDTLYDNLRFHGLDWPTTRYLLALYADPAARGGRPWPELIRHVRDRRE